MADVREQAETFFRSWQEMSSIYEDCAKSLGMSYSGLYVLHAIYTNRESCTQKWICEYTFLPKQTVNAIIRTFWKKGFVKLTEVESDRRNKMVVLTEAGIAYADDIIPRIQKAELRAMEKLTERQRVEMVKSTNQYIHHFNQYMSELFDLRGKPHELL